MSRVKAHTRVVNGKRQRVRSHARHLQPRRAGRNLQRANRHRRRKQHGQAAMWCGIAAAELGGWALFRTAGVALVTAGVVLVGAGLAARRVSKGPERPPVPRPVRPARERPSPPPRAQSQTPPERPAHLSQPGLSRSSQSFREHQWRNASPKEQAQQAEFYRLRETEGYTGPIQWDKGQMPRKTDG